MARVPYVEKDELAEQDRHVVESHSVRPEKTSHVHRAIGHHVPVAKARRDFSRAMWRETGLTDRQRELIILAVASELRSKYEWHQHVHFAVDDIVSVAEARQIAAGDTDGFDEPEEALLSYIGRFAAMDVDDATHERAAEFFSNEELVAIVMLAMNYVGLAYVIDGFDVEIEAEEFVGWDLEAF
jgi:alkylhydroperoxidase family enzyme